jgi:hypothetical protein
MNPFLERIAFLAPAVIVAVLAGVFAFALWQRAWDGPRLPLDEMLRRHGILLAAGLSPGISRELALAARRCAGCGARDACRGWLDSGRSTGHEEFCGNADFISHAKDAGLEGRGATIV